MTGTESQVQQEMVGAENQVQQEVAGIESQVHQAVAGRVQLDMTGPGSQVHQEVVDTENQLQVEQVGLESQVQLDMIIGNQVQQEMVDTENQVQLEMVVIESQVQLDMAGSRNQVQQDVASTENQVQKEPTSLDSKESLVATYSRAEENLRKLEELGCTRIHEVDAHIMFHHPFLFGQLFDRIVFNFPHSGFYYLEREHDLDTIMRHQRLVEGFLDNAAGLLDANGEVHVTHKTAYPFSKWEIEKLALDAGLYLIKKPRFSLSDYPGYTNKKGNGLAADSSFPIGQCCTFKFGLDL